MILRTPCLLAGFAVAILLAAPGAASAENLTDLHGSGDLLELGIDLDAAGAPTRLQIEADQTRCPGGGTHQMRPRQFRDFDLATPERFEHRASFTERDSGFVAKAKVRIVGRRVGEERWKGRYETTVRVFYKGTKVGICRRQGREAIWHAGPLEAGPPEPPPEEEFSASASAADLSGSGSYLKFWLVQDDSYVPVQLDLELDWTRCRHGGWVKMHPRTFTGFELATAEILDHRGSYSEKNERWRLEVAYHLSGRHTVGDRWEGRYETTIRVFYKGHRVDTCMREGRKSIWYAGVL